MRIQNESGVPTKTLRPLLKFALECLPPEAQMAQFRILDGDPRKTMGGLADMDGGCGATPSMVTLWLTSPQNGMYPRADQHVPELDPVTLNSWTEEVLLIVAHELQHVVQFYDDESYEDAHVMEVDAEAQAIQVLNAWRRFSTKRAA
jgi:hypothetical protein